METLLQEKFLDAMRRNHVKLVTNINTNKCLLNYLVTSGVLTEHQVDDIKLNGLRNAKDRNETLLNMIRRTSQQKYDKFVRALCEDEQSDLANLLHPELVKDYYEKIKLHERQHNFARMQGKKPIQEEVGYPVEETPMKSFDDPFHSDSRKRKCDSTIELPDYLWAKWTIVDTEENRMQSSSEDDILLADCKRLTLNVHRSERNHYNSTKDKSYSIDYRIRGRLLVINVQDNRRGTDIDRDNIIELFENFHFQVTDYNDDDGLTAREILEKVEHFARDPINKRTAMVAICVLSHGENDGFYGTDGTLVKYDDMYDKFSNEKAPNLKEKPKLYFIQACRGEETDVGVAGDEVGDAKVEFEPIEKRVPKHSDYLIARATQKGYIAWRSPSRGSWFFQALVRTFERDAASNDLVTMLTTVNRVIQHNMKTEKKIQASEFTSGLTQHVNFYPGIKG